MSEVSKGECIERKQKIDETTDNISMVTHIDYVNSWSKFTSWQSVNPPSRPSKALIELYSGFLKNCDRAKAVAVLGSTIEFRDLLAEMKFLNVYVLEKNREFYNYITPFAHNMLKETFVEGDWLLTLQNCPKFSIILSDLTSGNIPYDNRQEFYRNISSTMTDDGLFFDRVLTKPIPFISLSSLIEKYKNLPVNNENANSFNCEVLFCSELLNNQECVVDTMEFYNKLLALNIQKITEFVTACYEITPPNCVWWYSKDWETEKSIYEQYLKIKLIHDEPQTSEYYNRAKTLISTRRLLENEKSAL